MTQPRAVPNKVRWALEDIYKELMAADQRITSLINEPVQTRTAIINIAAMSQLHIRTAREHITRVHPNARDIVIRQARGASDD